MLLCNPRISLGYVVSNIRLRCISKTLFVSYNMKFLCFLNRCLAAGRQVIRRTTTSAQSISILALGIVSGLQCQMHTGVWYIVSVKGTTSTICMDPGGLLWKTSMRRTFLCIGFSSALVTLFGLMQVCGIEQQGGQRKEEEVNTTAFLLRILFMTLQYMFLSDSKY